MLRRSCPTASATVLRTDERDTVGPWVLAAFRRSKDVTRK